ncbi:hypothetical protein NEMIN01_0567 [Nematocida minor]|uniref:uncharacterized protein n=1 Tax=Nematocida minor TaxID=1912983 RepID=UPI002220CF7C|nr:uncharacterized protein NEMIN01_0567 [Nematocida minor]KAI5189614.1 hypothetical protein NEMIN01_0567 [Nematocida minor]
MHVKTLLRRKLFIAINVLYIAVNLLLAIKTAVVGKYNLFVQISSAVFSMCVSALVFVLGIHYVSINCMMYEIYLGGANAAVLLFVLFLLFLLHFKASAPLQIIFENIPIIAVSIFSVLVSVYVAFLRKCIVDGLVYPIFIQRRKKIESRAVLVRREYPEIFTVQ